MNAAIREIVEYVETHPGMSTTDAVDSYFRGILWSLEKDEFRRMTPKERQHFVEAIDIAAKGR